MWVKHKMTSAAISRAKHCQIIVVTCVPVPLSPSPPWSHSLVADFRPTVFSLRVPSLVLPHLYLDLGVKSTNLSAIVFTVFLVP